MTENNDELIVRKFFEEKKKEVPDNGFTQRVMRQLSDRTRRISHIWTAVYTAVCAVIIVNFGWIDQLLALCHEIVGTIFSNSIISTYPILLLYPLLFIIFIGGYKAMTDDK